MDITIEVLKNNPFNFSIRSADCLGTTESNIFFQYVQCLQGVLVIRSRLLSFVGGGRWRCVCEVLKTIGRVLIALIFTVHLLFAQTHEL